MNPRYRVSRSAIDLIKRFEGYRRTAGQLADGRWTIGYGHTLTARAGAEVSEQDAEALLTYDLIAVAHSLNEWVYTPLTQNQFDALCSFAFNIGLESFRRSAVLRRLNEGALLQAAAAMELWRKTDFEGQRIVVDAMVRRRSAEKILFLTPADGVWIPSPTPVLPPRLDMDLGGAVPREAPTAVTTALEGDRIVLHRDGPEAPDAPVSGRNFTPREDEGPSPLQRAAASVTARLQNIFRSPERRSNVTPVDFSRPEPSGVPARFQPGARSAGEQVLELTPPEDDEVELMLEPTPARARVDLVAANEAAPGLFDSQLSSANDQTAIPETEIVQADAGDAPYVRGDGVPLATRPRRAPEGPESTDMGALVVLAVAGVGVFLGSLYWFFNGWGGEQANLVGKIAVWVAAAAGVVCFSIAAYLMLERLGRAAGDLGDE